MYDLYYEFLTTNLLMIIHAYTGTILHNRKTRKSYVIFLEHSPLTLFIIIKKKKSYLGEF